MLTKCAYISETDTRKDYIFYLNVDSPKEIDTIIDDINRNITGGKVEFIHFVKGK